MHEPAYIAIGEDGHVTLFWGDGTEDYKEIIVRGPRPESHTEMVAIIEELRAWAEERGYRVVVPAIDLEYTEIEIDLTEDDELNLTTDDVDDLLDDLFWAEDAGEED